MRYANFVLTFVIFNAYISKSYCQKKYNRSVEFSPYYSLNLSFSHLTNTKVFSNVKFSKFSSPAQLNPLNFGIRIERKLKKDSLGLSINASLASMSLSIASSYKLIGSKDGHESIIANFTDYFVFSLGVKKRISKLKAFTVSGEFGGKLLIPQSNGPTSDYWIRSVQDTLVYAEFSSYHPDRTFVTPYFGVDFEYKVKKIKIGGLFWYQNSFNEVIGYNFNVFYGNEKLYSKSISTGQAIGFNLYVKLFVL